MTSPGTGDEATGSPGAGPDGSPAHPSADADFDPFRFGRPEPGSPAAAAFPHLYPPQPPTQPPQFQPPSDQTPSGQFPPPDPSSGYGYPPPGPYGYPPPGYDSPGYGNPAYGNPAYGYPGGPPVAKPGNGRAVAGLILGICSVVFFFLTFLDLPVVILGVIFSRLGLKASRTGQGQRGVALAGLILSIIGAVVVAAFTVFLLHQINHCQQHHDQGTRAYNECIVHF